MTREDKTKEELLEEIALLRSSNEQRQAILDASPAMIFYKDKENRFIRVNEALARSNGMSREKMEGKTMWDLYPREAADHYWQDDKEVMVSGNPKFNIVEEMKTPHGIMWVETNKIPLRDLKGEIVGIVGFTLDITERKQAEGKVKRMNEEWRRTFDAISDSVFILDKDNTIRNVNKVFLDTFGLKEDQVIGKKCYEVVHKSDKPWIMCPHSQTMRDHKAHTEEVDDPVLGIPLLVSTSPIFDEKGELTGSVHIAKDITERKKTEEDLKRKMEELEGFNKIAVGRELKMIELKEKIKALEEGKK